MKHKKRKGRRRHPVVVVTIGAILLFAGARALPLVLRQRDTFRIRAVEVEGIEYLPAEQIVELTGIDTLANLFDPAETWLEHLRSHPLVENVKTRRRLPGTLVLQITERKPIAWVMHENRLVTIDAAAKALPIQPGSGVDLPVIFVNEGVDADSARLLNFAQALARLHAWAPEIYETLTEVHPASPGVLLVLESRTHEVFLPDSFDHRTVRQLQAVFDMIEKEELNKRLTAIDLRFANQAVLRLQ